MYLCCSFLYLFLSTVLRESESGKRFYNLKVHGRASMRIGAAQSPRRRHAHRAHHGVAGARSARRGSGDNVGCRTHAVRHHHLVFVVRARSSSRLNSRTRCGGRVNCHTRWSSGCGASLGTPSQVNGCAPVRVDTTRAVCQPLPARCRRAMGVLLDRPQRHKARRLCRVDRGERVLDALMHE